MVLESVSEKNAIGKSLGTVSEKFGGIGIGIRKNCYRKKVSEPVLEKFGGIGIGMIQKKLLPEKSLGTGIGKIWYRN